MGEWPSFGVLQQYLPCIGILLSKIMVKKYAFCKHSKAYIIKSYLEEWVFWNFQTIALFIDNKGVL